MSGCVGVVQRDVGFLGFIFWYYFLSCNKRESLMVNVN